MKTLETSSQIEKDALEQLESELRVLTQDQKMGESNGPSSWLSKAHDVCPELFDIDHKLAFLRAESFDGKAAAARMKRYWDTRAELFGEQKMFLPVTQVDALCDDHLALSSGILQLLPEKDLAGRALVFYDPSKHEKAQISNKSVFRILWYILHVAMEDSTVRENGFVLLVYPKKCTNDQIDRNLISRGSSIMGNDIPLQWKEFHICHPCSFYNTFFPLLKLLFPEKMKDGIVVNFGTDDHVLQCLASHSMPADRLPSDLGGGEVLDFEKWLLQRRKLESAGTMMDTDEIDSDRITTGHTSIESKSSGKLEETNDGMSEQQKQSKSLILSGSPLPVMIKSTNSSNGACSTRFGETTPPPLHNILSSQNNESSETKPGISKSCGAARAKRPGRKGDARMHRAVVMKLENADISLVDALVEGGFEFGGLNEKGRPHHEIFDQEGVSLMQRKNQLLRRVRTEKKKRDEASNG